MTTKESNLKVAQCLRHRRRRIVYCRRATPKKRQLVSLEEHNARTTSTESFAPRHCFQVPARCNHQCVFSRSAVFVQRCNCSKSVVLFSRRSVVQSRRCRGALPLSFCSAAVTQQGRACCAGMAANGSVVQLLRCCWNDVVQLRGVHVAANLSVTRGAVIQQPGSFQAAVLLFNGGGQQCCCSTVVVLFTPCPHVQSQRLNGGSSILFSTGVVIQQGRG